MNSKKISELSSLNLSTSDLQNNNRLFVPIVQNNGSNYQNYKMDMYSVYSIIKSKIMEEVQQAIDDIPEGGGGSSDSSDYNALVNRIIALENRINQFNDPTYWPTNYIGIKNTNTNDIIYYGLPSGPGQTGIRKDEIVITESNAQLPDLYCITNINTPIGIENSNYKVDVTFTPKTRESGLSLNGGTIHEIYIYGVMNTSNGSVDIVGSLNFENGLTFARGQETFSPADYQITLYTSQPSTTTITNIELRTKIGVKINGLVQYVEVPGATAYYKSGNSMITQQATGYITLPTNGE